MGVVKCWAYAKKRSFYEKARELKKIFETMKTQLATFAVLVFLLADACWAKGFGTGRKNALVFKDWPEKHQTFDECVKSKCETACKKKSQILIGEKKDYKQVVLSSDCTNCEAGCFVPAEGESMHLVVNGKGKNTTKRSIRMMREQVREAIRRKQAKHQAYKTGRTWRIRE